MNMPTATNLILDPDYYVAAEADFNAKGTGPLSSTPSFITFERLYSSAPHLLKDSTIEALLKAFPTD